MHNLKVLYQGHCGVNHSLKGQELDYKNKIIIIKWKYSVINHMNLIEVVQNTFHIYTFIHPCIHVSIYLSIYPSMYLSIYLSIYALMYPSIHLCIHSSIHPSIYPSIHTCIHKSKHPSIYAFILSVHLTMQ